MTASGLDCTGDEVILRMAEAYLEIAGRYRQLVYDPPPDTRLDDDITAAAALAIFLGRLYGKPDDSPLIDHIGHLDRAGEAWEAAYYGFVECLERAGLDAAAAIAGPPESDYGPIAVIECTIEAVGRVLFEVLGQLIDESIDPLAEEIV